MLKVIKEKKIVLSYLLTAFLVFFFCRSYFFDEISASRMMFGLAFVVLATILFVNVFFILWDGRCKEYFYIVACSVISSFPFWTQNFLYGDDLWGFQKRICDNPIAGVYVSRPFLEFWVLFLRKFDFRDIRYLRIYMCLWFTLFGLLVYAGLRKLGVCKYKALIFGIICSSGLSVIDCIGYISVFPIAMALVCVITSFYLYVGINSNLHRWKHIMYLEASMCLVLAFCTYQIATPLFFACYYIWINESKETRTFVIELKKFLVDISFFGVNAIAYLVFTKLVQYFSGISNTQNARGEIKLSLEFLIHKIVWFVTNVIPQAIADVAAIFWGNKIFKENNLFYFNSFNNNVFKTATVLIFILCYVAICIHYYKKKRSIFALLFSFLVPFFAYYPFLILPEDGYTTYYAISLILLFSWFVIESCFQLISLLTRKVELRSCFVAVASLIIVLQSSNYAQNVWVNYNLYRYSYIKNALSIELKKDPQKKQYYIGR